MKILDDNARYKLLKILEHKPNLSQRALAKELGISLGKTNYCIKGLMEMGWIKVGNFARNKNKKEYSYLLTPSGIEEKAKVTLRFLKWKQHEHEVILKEIEQIRSDATNIKSLKSSNTVWHHATVTRKRREELNNHKSAVLWFTGLSGAGKSTLAHEVEEALHQLGCRTLVLDGDNVRHGLCGDLTFSDDDRHENIRRIGEMSKLFIESGAFVLTAFISPFREDRRRVRDLVGLGDFIEVYCNCSVSVCESRDLKGLYKKARAGDIKDFTGISSPYEEPENPEIVVDTGKSSLDECVNKIVGYLKENDYLNIDNCELNVVPAVIKT